jgi:hypothetical protein
MNEQTIIVFIILLICILLAGYKLFRFFKKGRTQEDEKCGNCAYKMLCHEQKSGKR